MPGLSKRETRSERVHRTLQQVQRDEVVDACVLETVEQVCGITDTCLHECKEERPHGSLGRVPPLTITPRPLTGTVSLTGILRTVTLRAQSQTHRKVGTQSLRSLGSSLNDSGVAGVAERPRDRARPTGARATQRQMGSVRQLRFATAPKNWISESGHLRSLYAKFTTLVRVVALARADSHSDTCSLRRRWDLIRLHRGL
jgi:hypothetical protein